MKKMLLCMAIACSLPIICSAKTKLVLIGDASMAPHSIATPDVRGWGEKLTDYFTDQVEIVNVAQAGESTHTLEGKRLEMIMEQCDRGDFVLIQVGQNDLREEYGHMYYSTLEMGENLTEIVKQLQKKKLKVILCTPIAHPYYVDGKAVNRMGGYSNVIRNVAKLTEAYLLDIEAISKTWLDKIGEKNASLFFKNTNHGTERHEYLLTETGATEIGRMVANEIRSQKIPHLKKQVVLTIVE